MSDEAPDKAPPSPEETLQGRLKELRQARGYSARRLAERLQGTGVKLGRAAISKIEAGQRSVSVDEAFALAWALDASPLALLLPPGWEETGKHEGEQVTIAGRSVPANLAADWIKGEAPIPEQAAVFFHSELRDGQWAPRKSFERFLGSRDEQ